MWELLLAVHDGKKGARRASVLRSDISLSGNNSPTAADFSLSERERVQAYLCVLYKSVKLHYPQFKSSAMLRSVQSLPGLFQNYVPENPARGKDPLL